MDVDKEQDTGQKGFDSKSGRDCPMRCPSLSRYDTTHKPKAEDSLHDFIAKLHAHDAEMVKPMIFIKI